MSGFQDYGFRVRPISDVVQAMESTALTLTAHRQIGKGTGRFHMLLAARGEGVEPSDTGPPEGAP
jgi:hypothetical protein